IYTNKMSKQMVGNVGSRSPEESLKKSSDMPSPHETARRMHSITQNSSRLSRIKREKEKIEMATMTGGQAIVESLKAEEVSNVFGLIGSAGMEIFDALYEAETVRFIGVRDERTGVHMADGYA